MLEAISGFIIHLIQTLGYLGVTLLMTLESALIPIPSEITLPFAGFLAQKGTFFLPIVIAASVLGDTIGTMIIYAIGFFLEEEVVLRILDKYGKFILFSKKEYEHVMHWFQKHGAIIITIAKLLPGFRSIIGLPAGLSETPFWKVFFYTVLGSAIWCTTFVYAGYVLGANWKGLEPIFRKFELIIAVVIVIGTLWYINHKLRLIKRRK